MRMVRPTAFGRALDAQRRQRQMTRPVFADLIDAPDKLAQQWEYGQRGISSARASRLARALGLPPWHFEQALAEDRLAHVCRAAEVTAVIVGLASYIESKLPGEQWAAVRAMLLGGL